MKIKFVVDSNVHVAAKISPEGRCAEVTQQVIDRHELFSSEGIIADVLRRLKELGRSAEPLRLAEESIREGSHILDPQPLPPDVCRDPNDAAILGLAVAARAQCILTGDKDLLVLGQFRGIDIIRPGDFFRYEAEHSG